MAAVCFCLALLFREVAAVGSGGPGGEWEAWQHEQGVPCVTNAAAFSEQKVAAAGAATSPLPSCPLEDALRLHDLTPKHGVWGGPREPVSEPDVEPFVYLALLWAPVDTEAEYSLSLSLHNAAAHLPVTLGRLFGSTVGRWELTIVVDDCIDDTLQVLVGILWETQAIWREAGLEVAPPPVDPAAAACGDRLQPSLPLRIRVVVAEAPLYETRLENLAFTTSTPRSPGGFYVSLQGDMVLCELGWNYFLSLPVRAGGKYGLAAVGARYVPGTHGHDIFKTYEEDKGHSADEIRRSQFYKVGFYKHGNRGPLLWSAEAMQKVEFFDEQHYFQGWDDADLFARMVALEAYAVTFFPVAVYAPREFKPKRVTTHHDRLAFSRPSLRFGEWFNSSDPRHTIKIDQSKTLHTFAARGMKLNRAADSPTTFSQRVPCCQYFTDHIASSPDHPVDPFHTSRCCEPVASPAALWPDRPKTAQIPPELFCPQSETRTLGRVSGDVDRTHGNHDTILRDTLAVTQRRQPITGEDTASIDGQNEEARQQKRSGQPHQLVEVPQAPETPPPPYQGGNDGWVPLECTLMRGRWNEEHVFTPTARKILAAQMQHALCNVSAVSQEELRRLVASQALVQGALMDSGLGSALHKWSAQLCHALDKGGMLVLDRRPWKWGASAEQELGGYFAPTHCNLSMSSIQTTVDSLPGDGKLVESIHNIGVVLKLQNCLPRWDTNMTTSEWRAAAMEFLFRRLGDDLHRKICRAFDQVFGPLGGVPRDRLISIHMRWGDKYKEMASVSEDTYVKAVQRLVAEHGIKDPVLFVMTEDRLALDALKAAIAKKQLNYTILTSAGPRKMDFNPEAAEISLIQLAIGLEANYYIGTSGSNWSRLMNELRLTRINGICGGQCTVFVDLNRKPMEWRV